MDFEHIVQVNDPRDPELPVMEAGALWAALLLLVREPRRLRPDLDHVEVIATGPDSWYRKLGFGSLLVIDEVLADPATRTLTQRILAPPGLSGGSRMIAIETPAPGHLILRFRYSGPHVDADPGIGDSHHGAFRSAWLHADLDQVRVLRELLG